MGKHLEEMSNEELWRLFPVVLSGYTSDWEKNYSLEEANLKNALGKDAIFRISHIGSTAVAGLTAKPIIDILVEVFETTANQRIFAAMQAAGYLFSPQPARPAPHMMFMKGYTEQGFAEKVYHVHVRYPGDWAELYFRDYLRDNPATAAEYGERKEALLLRYKHDRDGYTSEKSEFILKISERAKKAYAGRYTPV